MVTIWCKFCLIQIEVRNWSRHIIDQQHKKNLPYKIIVRGSFQTKELEEVHQYFAKFGKIVMEDVAANVKGETFVQYFFEDPAVYSVIAHKQHLLGGKLLQVSWCMSFGDDKPNIQRSTNSLSISNEESDFSMSDMDVEDISSDFSDEFLNVKKELKITDQVEKRVRSKSPSLCKKKKLDKIKIHGMMPPPDPADMSNTESFFRTTTPVVSRVESVDKAFALKKITFTDYLTILKNKGATASLSPAQAEKNTIILAQCEQAIAAMSHNEQKLFKIKPRIPQQKPRSSPVVNAMVKLKFTSFRKETFSSVFYSTLRDIGIVGKETDVHKLIDSVTDLLCADVVDRRRVSAEILQISLLGTNTNKKDKKKMKNVGTQCRKPPSRSVSVQVGNDRL